MAETAVAEKTQYQGQMHLLQKDMMGRYFERVTRAGLGQAGASETQFRVWVGDWEVSGDGARGGCAVDRCRAARSARSSPF